jgi:hypothetical protein
MEPSWRAWGQTFMVVGGFLFVMGLVLVLLGGRTLSWPKLPGDVVIERPGLRLYLPIGTSIAISIGLSLLFWLIRRFFYRGDL